MTGTAKANVHEAVLVERCRRGDSAAMEQLLLSYQDRIYNVILRICANVDDAAELTQETFVKIIENIGGFESRSSFYTWAFRIAVNLTLNHCRRNGKLAVSSLDAEQYEYSRQAKQALKDFLQDEGSPDPAGVAANNELYGILLETLMKLNDAHRAVIVLRDIEGMNYIQIAKVLDVNLGTVRSRLSRARSNLREMIMEAVSE